MKAIKQCQHQGIPSTLIDSPTTQNGFDGAINLHQLTEQFHYCVSFEVIEFSFLFTRGSTQLYHTYKFVQICTYVLDQDVYEIILG